MKSEIWIVRHAKSSWADLHQSDHDRILNERGHSDSPKMAKMILPFLGNKLYLCSSTATRAKTTAEYFATEFASKDYKLDLFSHLYHASSWRILEHLQHVETDADAVFIFAHNNGITDFVNALHVPLLNDVPTCGICRIKSTANSFADLEFENMSLVDHYFPKQTIY